MSNSYFQFKQFTVHHDRCAMKVGTDGVLLGAWVELGTAQSILDIGTGTGLIALMLAQRSDDNFVIDAIDIDKDSILQAKENVSNSTFFNINCIYSSLQDYQAIDNKRYDLIVSNPPFFSSSLHSPDEQRTVARHTDTLSMEEFFHISSKLLSDNGRIALIFPHSEKELLIKLAQELGLHATMITNVCPTTNSLPKRVLLEFSRIKSHTKENDLTIEKERHKYSSEFVALAKDFYLKM